MLQIAHYLGPASLVNLARSCKAIFFGTHFGIQVQRAVYEIRTAVSIEAIRTAIETADNFPPAWRTHFYSAIARRAGYPTEPAHASQIARLLTECASTRLDAADRAHLSITLLGTFHHRMAPQSDPEMQQHEDALHAYMLDESSPERGRLMAAYLSVIRDLPPAQQEPAYWVRTVSAFTPSQAAATLLEASRWMFPLKDTAKCDQAFLALLRAARSLRDMDGRALPSQALLLEGLINIVFGYWPGWGPDPRGCWDMLYDAVLALPMDLRVPLLCNLAKALQRCSIDRHTMQRQWCRLLEAAPELPPAWQGELLCQLVHAFDFTAWCVGGDDDPDSDPDSRSSDENDMAIPYRNVPPTRAEVQRQRHHPAAQAAIAQCGARLIAIAVGLPATEREQVRRAMSKMLKWRTKCWQAAPWHALRSRLKALTPSSARPRPAVA